MGAQEKTQGNSNSMQACGEVKLALSGIPDNSLLGKLDKLRVKVYRLNEDGKWDDQGTGHVTVDYLERSEELALFVFDEEDNETLLLHRISPDDIYRKQEDTIISWRDSEYSTELALSFQENTGCSYIWDHICNVQRNMHFSSLNNEIFHTMNSELRELPAVELSTLPIILKTVTESGIADQMRLTELILNDQDFFQKLMELFRICEDLENIDGLHMIFKIIKGIILLNSPQVFEKIFGDELIMDIIGSLEYDADVPQVQHYRLFLKEHVVFKEAIPIKNPLALSKIHQTYRVGYLKDVVLARVLDEATTASLNSIIHSNNAIVISILKDDSTFIQELFARLRSPTTSAESKKNLVYFLHEFCSLSKSLQVVQQLRLFRDLINEGIFDIITDVLQSPDKKLVLTGTDILILFLNQDANLLRSYVVRQEGIPLFGLLVKGMVTDFGEDMHCQFLEILRSLLDSFTLSGAQRDSITDIFYEKHLGELIDVIILSCSSDEADHFLSLDEHLINHFVKNNLLKPVIDAFVANGNRYNVLNSAILELFEYIRKENMKLLVKYIVDSFWNQLVKFENLASIHSLKIKYEQCLENCGTKMDVNAPDPRKRIDERALEKEEEDYFNEDSDEDDTTSASHPRKVQPQPVSSNGVVANRSSLSPRSGGLVDYEDDDDDEDYKPPPPRKQTETSEEDEGMLESIRSKRKLNPKEKEHELSKKQRLGKSSKSRDSVFAALCSTLSQAVLPSKKTANTIHLSTRSAEGNEGSGEENHLEKESSSPDDNCSEEDNHRDKGSPRNCSDNRQLTGEDSPLIPPKSSPEMAVNGS
ncbi:serine/threonine-protein phosphatase 4 regulatory subunit 3-like isoform X1 [Gossypium australe]|uniref:Serine/threonine-protein phosphatase 4 regulatory subunit 3-like isoform X1 n=1 Tax=Gossypium australe TaxID=47621 RepID=A0A5B6UB31_9ROSI|nr:serine/threonine-protein phosphatase 4 regulatory subunit 3-like isoform X1 [Gossypium australe]